MLPALSTAYSAYAAFERVRRDYCPLAFKFFFSNDDPCNSVSVQAWELTFYEGGTAVLTISGAGITFPEQNRMLVILSDANKQVLSRESYTYALYNVTNRRTEVVGSFAWQKGRPSAQGVLTPPDLKVIYSLVSGDVAIGGLIITGKEGPAWLTPKGNWQPNILYATGDGVIYDGSTYRRKAGGMSGSVFDLSQWDVVAQAATMPDKSVTRTKLDTSLQATLERVETTNPTGYEQSSYAYAVIDDAGRIAFYVDANGRLSTPQIGDVSAAVLQVQALGAYTWPDESGYVWGIVDMTGQIALGLDATGTLVLKGQPLPAYLQTVVAALVAGGLANFQASIDLLNSYQFTWPNEGGYAWGISDQAGRVALGVSMAGKVLVAGQVLDMNQYNQITINTALLIPSTNLVFWGDSITAAMNMDTLKAQLGDNRQLTKMGVGGDTSSQIAFRQGAIAALLSVANNTIPASGSVAVTLVNPALQQAGQSKTGTLGGIPGTLTRANDGSHTFSRTTAGAITLVESQVNFVPDSPNEYDTAIIWAGQNNLGQNATILADVRAMVTNLKAFRKRFLILAVGGANAGSKESAGYTSLMALNNALRDEYPANYIDMRAILIRNYNPNNAQDVTDFTNDIIPSSLRIDAVHLSEAAYTAVVFPEIKRVLTSKNW
jgi:hypothetical protein